MIKFQNTFIHWNYFLVLEEEIIHLNKYIEFHEKNLEVFSIELTRIYLSICSEIDVLLKQICKLKGITAGSIGLYKKIIVNDNELKGMVLEKVRLDRYSLEFNPWEKWSDSDPNTHPIWWNDYNKVKHHRGDFYERANLKNTLNSIAALSIVNSYYHQLLLSKEMGRLIDFGEVHSNTGGDYPKHFKITGKLYPGPILGIY